MVQFTLVTVTSLLAVIQLTEASMRYASFQPSLRSSGMLLKRQGITCPPGLTQCDATHCAGVCCFNSAGVAEGGCEIGEVCIGEGATGACCPVGANCGGGPPPCVNAGQTAVAPTQACETDTPICTSNAQGGPLCEGTFTDWLSISSSLFGIRTTTTRSVALTTSATTTAVVTTTVAVPTTTSSSSTSSTTAVYVPPTTLSSISITSSAVYVPPPPTTYSTTAIVTPIPPAYSTSAAGNASATQTSPPIATGEGYSNKPYFGILVASVLFAVLFL